MKLNPNEKNAFEALWQLIKFSNITVTATSLKNTLLQHQNATTLLGMSDVLNEFNIPNLATRLPIEQLQTIPLPAIAYFEANGGTFVTIKKIENDLVEWYHDTAGVFKEPIHNFIHKWHGITLLVEPNAQSGEVNYKEARKNEIIEKLRIPFVITGLLTVIGIILYPILQQIPIDSNFQFYALLLTKTLGIITSTMLVWYDFDANNSFLKSVCEINGKTNCSNILNSQASKFWGWLTWSEIGLFYFTGGFLALLLINTDATKYLLFFTLMALPYTFWSIYYQAIVVKEWCPMCVAVQILLWAEFLLLLPISFQNIELSIFQGYNFLLLCISFFIFPIFWAFVKTPLKKSLRTDSLYIEFQKLKLSPEYINILLSKELLLPPFFKGLNTLQLGNPHASNRLILVLNPMCASCRTSYLTAKRLLESDIDINVHIVLATSLALDDEAAKVARIILSQDTDETIMKAIDEWFKDSSKNINNWIKKLEKVEANTQGQQQLAIHIRWLELAGISEAPATFLNNHEIPKIYLARDVEKIIKHYSTIGFANQQ